MRNSIKGLRILQTGPAKGKVLSVHKLFADMRSSYTGSNAEEFFAGLNDLEKQFREKYGSSVPADEAYKWTIRFQKGLDPFGSADD